MIKEIKQQNVRASNLSIEINVNARNKTFRIYIYFSALWIFRGGYEISTKTTSFGRQLVFFASAYCVYQR